MACISSASLAILINGEATKTFSCERGLRQGCSLSPLLFILSLEGLSILLKSKQAEGLLKGVKVAGLTHILHIFFADDVLILTSANLDEWTIIHSILSSFCAVSGLQINTSKSSFYFSKAPTSIKLALRDLFGFSSKELEEGFHYLGFFLKAGRYTSKDWSWIVDIFKARILNWKHRFLSMGGRYILIKAVLESLPVYWMALAQFPVSILKSLRQLIFTFLWTGCKKTKSFHLCKWEELSKPKTLGGWGLKHLPTFQKALTTNIFWRILTKPGLWSSVISAKYLHQLPVHLWIRFGEIHPATGSPTWRNLSATLPIILNWLAWDPGDGRLIEVGRDSILDLGRKALLSTSLLSNLHSKNLVYLNQFFNSSFAGAHRGSWLSGSDLHLNRAHSLEWDNLVLLLKASGIYLKEKPDSLLWMGGDRSGRLSAKNVYISLAAISWTSTTVPWRQRIWKASCPLKCKLFTWLLLENKLLFWTNLQARGWEGPSRCSLCSQAIETSLHVFVLCPFTCELWTATSLSLKIPNLWIGTSILSCFQHWIHNSSYPLLPIYLCWFVWLARNNAIFNDKKPSIPHCSSLIRSEANKLQNFSTVKPAVRRPIHIPLDRAVAWFDGASQLQGTLCGAGGKIRLNSHSSIIWSLNCSQGTNTKAELLGVWTTLFLASRHTEDLHLLGDSKIIIDWLNGRADLRVAALNCWKARIKDFTILFRNLTCLHIFRDENKEADILSKKALHLPPLQIYFTFWEDGHEGITSKIKI